jgi:methylglutaconyl-CoA hydratase
MNYHTLTLESTDTIATLMLRRPEKRNALTSEMIEEIVSALWAVESAPARVLILGGQGEAFCAGMDLEYLRGLTTQSQQDSLEDSRRIAKMFRLLHSFPKPLIAAVQGPAVAGGCGIAMMADFTLAAPEAKFGFPEVRVGFIPAIVAVFLVRQIGEKRARDLLLSGRLIGAEEARELGLVNEVVARERLQERARELAAQLSALSPTSLQSTKRLLREFCENDINREIELAVLANARIRSTADYHEGVTAFLEKRKPVWRQAQ